MELVSNPGFAQGAKGWLLSNAQAEARAGHGGSATVRLEAVAPAPESWSHVGVSISDPPANHALYFECWLMGQDAPQTALVNAFAYDDQGKVVANYTAQQNVTPGAWQPFAAEYVVPPGASRLTIWVINRAAQPLFVSDSHLKVGGAKKMPLGNSLDGVGVLRVIERTPVCVKKDGQTGVVTFPIPGTYRDQIPLSFDVETTPPDALQSYQWRKRPDGNNWLCDARVSPNRAGCILKYEALVLVGTRADAILPKATKPEVTPEAAAWTRSTACVQSDDPAIKAKAAELAAFGPDIEAYARRVMEFTSTNHGEPGVKFDTLDARKALDCGGSCTSRANLAAALLRARGIPARTVAHLPTWVASLYEHWLVEYWHPGIGWVWMDSSRNQFQPQPWTLAVLNVANPEDEDKAFDPVHTKAVMPGAPYQAVIELDKTLYWANLYEDADGSNSAAPVARIEGSAQEMTTLFAAARSAFPALAAQNEAGKNAPERAKQIEAAAKNSVHDLMALLQARQPTLK